MASPTKQAAKPEPSALLRLFGPRLQDDKQRRALQLAELVANGFIQRTGFNFDLYDGGPSFDRLAEKIAPLQMRESREDLERLDALARQAGIQNRSGGILFPSDVAAAHWHPQQRAAAYVAFVIGYRFAQQSAGREG